MPPRHPQIRQREQRNQLCIEGAYEGRPAGSPGLGTQKRLPDPPRL